MNTDTLIKAAIIEAKAVECYQMAGQPTATHLGQTALYNIVDGLIWALSALTAEPMADIRARVKAAAADAKPLNQYRPRLVVC
jgi:hypothetical protein